MRTPEEIQKDIEVLKKELVKSMKFHKRELLPIDDPRIRRKLGKDYYSGYMEKIVWEEDD
jgi:hypothetical protein